MFNVQEVTASTNGAEPNVIVNDALRLVSYQETRRVKLFKCLALKNTARIYKTGDKVLPCLRFINMHTS